MVSSLYTFYDIILSESILKLHTLKQSLLVSLWTSLLSVPMGADQPLLGDQLPQPAGVRGVAEMGSKVVKPNRAPITNDADFIEALNDMNRTELWGNALATKLVEIKTFLDKAHGTLSLQIGQDVLNALMIVTSQVDSIYVYKLLSAKRLNQREVTTYYRESGLTRILRYLQKVTKRIIKKINSQNLNLLVEKYGIKMFCSDQGALYILQDKNGELPVFIGNDISQSDKDIAFIVNYGDFFEGVPSRAFAYVEKRLVIAPGLFLERNKSSLQVTIYQGYQKSTIPFKASSVRSSVRDQPITHHELYPIFEKFSPKAKISKSSDEWARFIPISDCDDIEDIATHLIEYNAISSSEAFLSVMTFLAELMSREEDRQVAMAQQVQKKPVPKKNKPKSKGSRRKPVVVQTAVGDLLMKNDGAAETSGVGIPGGSIAPVLNKIELEESSGVEPPQILTAAAPDEEMEESDEALTVLAKEEETPFTKEQIKQSLYDQVMETVPEGRIKQRVLDRLINEWLEMTNISIDQLQRFVRGSHRTLHGPNGGFTVVRRHNGNDYAPGEVRQLAGKVLGFADSNIE